jgi:hypothetical protein
MKPALLSAFFLSVSTLSCGTVTEPAREPDATRPSAVVIIDVSVNEGTVAIAFTQANSALEPSVQYQVTCQSSSGKYTATGKASPITITGLTNGIRYSCTVTAVDTNGSSDPSTAVLVTPGAQLYDSSMLFLLTPGNGSATGFYSLPVELLGDPGPGFAAVTCNGGASMTTTTSAGHVVGSITITGLQNGVTYSCTLRITAASTVATSGPLDVIPGTPVRPLDPRGTPGNASATLSFLASTDNGFPVIGYTATCGATGQQSRTVSGASSPLIVTGLANGVAYSCNVYGSNAAGAGEKSASMPVTPGIPTAVQSITATMTSSSATFSFSPPNSDNGSPITGYTVTCGPFGPPGIQSPTPMSSGTASPITVTGLLANWAYNCVIFATNANGNGLKTYVGISTKS